MKPDYKNWMPKGMIFGGAVATVIPAVLLAIFAVGNILSGTAEFIAILILAVLTFIGFCATIWMILLYRAFSYNGKRQMSRHIIEGIAEYVSLPDGGKGLDVGCGSGALTIACAKRNPKAALVGIDRWGKEYASFSRSLCEKNAMAEGVSNVSFTKGDANSLEFPDECFDAVTSNYVYHNIPVKDRQSLLLETLRVLKKGGTFAIHDIFSRSKYGDMQAFLKKLRNMGYEKVELIDTTDGSFITKSESVWMELAGSALLVGKK